MPALPRIFATSLYMRYSSMSGVPPMPFMNAMTGEPVESRLTVDADADFHLVVTDVEGRLAGCRHRTARERHAHRAALTVDLLRQRDDRVEVTALFSRCSDDLPQQHRHTDTAATGGPQ